MTRIKDSLVWLPSELCNTHCREEEPEAKSQLGSVLSAAVHSKAVILTMEIV